MKLSLIIPTHRRSQSLKALLGSIVAQEMKSEDLQVLVISNLRDPLSQEVCVHYSPQFYDLKYLEVGTRGVNVARNLGIRYAGGEIFYFLDDDCILPDPGHLNRLLLKFVHNSQDVIGGRYMACASEGNRWAEFYLTNADLWLSTCQEQRTQFVAGNVAYRESIFARGFSFDYGIDFGGAEVSFHDQLYKSGFQLHLSHDMAIYHDIQIRLLGLIKKAFKQGQGAWKNHEENKVPRVSQNLSSLTLNHLRMPSFIYRISFQLGWNWASAKRGGAGVLLISMRLFFGLLLWVNGRCGHFRRRYYWMLPVYASKPFVKIISFTSYQYETRLKKIFSAKI